jgi:hypothetical protein
MAIRHGNWKLVKYDPAADGGSRSSRRNASSPSAPRLYDLAADIGEANDQAAAKPDKVAELQTLWQQWDAGLARPLWGPGS